ncbi:MAG: DUF4430 domain-containing protein [Candidatus Zixiibacteriota bacterium]
MKRYYVPVKPLFIIDVLVLLSILVLSNCSSDYTQPKHKNGIIPTTQTKLADSLVIELDGVDSLSVFEILKANHRVEYTSSLMGIFVSAIDSIENSSNLFWLYSVNDSMAQVSCDKYITKTGDKIKWHFRSSE